MPLPIRENIRRMTPYEPGKPIDEVKREFGLTSVIKLASNENPLGPSPLAVAAVREAATRMQLYPDGAAREFRAAISSKFGVPEPCVAIGNGSDELIHLLSLIFLRGPADEMIMGDPGFARYDAGAELVEAKLTKVPLDGELRHDLGAMARAAGPATKLVFIANPNNPTGTLVRRAAFEAFLDALPPQTVVVLDEAYGDFASEEPDVPCAADYVLAGRNVVGLRTLSKSHGLAGLRVGFGFAAEEVVEALHRAREPFNVNALAQVGGLAALGDDEHLRKTLANNAAGVATLSRVFERAGCRPYESFANFVYADLFRPARPIYRKLLEAGVITRPCDSFGAPTCLRVSVGLPAELERFGEAFEAAMAAP